MFVLLQTLDRWLEQGISGAAGEADMSGKIEISRELAERLVQGDASKGANALQLVDAWKAMDELRALLAAPVVERQPVAFIQIPKNIEKYGHGDYQDRLCFGKPGQFFVDGKSPMFDFVPLYTSPPAPVAHDMVRLLTRARIYARGEFRDEIDACLAGKTAPVAVVLPERMPHPQRGYDYTATGWNACLDKVKELNK
jgi:hypothetical protein